MTHPFSSDFSQSVDPSLAVPPDREPSREPSVPKAIELDAHAAEPVPELGSPTSSIVRTDITIPLLEERLQVDYQKRKIGEIIVRKEIATRTVEVPIRYEKLIIEQVSPERKTIAELNPTDLDRADPLNETSHQVVIAGEFSSPRVASQLLYELGKTLHSNLKKVRVEIELDDPALKQTYQDWLDEFIRTSSS